MAYVINSDKGKKIAENMTAGTKYTASDGSTWEKKDDGTVSVTTSKGETYDNAYSPTSGGGSSNSPYTGSSTGVQTYNSSQEAIKNQMNQNSIAWWSADDAQKKVLEAQNRELASQLGGNVSYNAGTGTWSGAAANNLYTTTDIEGWGKDYATNNPKPVAQKSDPRIDALLNQILNREDFSYDAASDPLYQQYAEMYQREGDRATRDTLAEVASGAGGMNSYAVTAAQQANSYYNSQLNDKIPELYQLAYEMYLNDKESMVQDLGLLQQMDNTQYNRYRDTISDYYNDKNFAYNSFYDAVQQGNWQTNFDYNAMWDNKNFNTDQYWKNKEWDYNDYWTNKEWDTSREDVDYDRNQYNKELATEEAWKYINMGITPSAELMAAAGMDEATVALAVNAVKAQLNGTSSGGSSGGGGSSRKSSGSDGYTGTGDDAGYGGEDTTIDTSTPKGSYQKVMSDLGLGLQNSESLLPSLVQAGAIYEENGKTKWKEGWNNQNAVERVNALNSIKPTVFWHPDL